MVVLDVPWGQDIGSVSLPYLTFHNHTRESPPLHHTVV